MSLIKKGSRALAHVLPGLSAGPIVEEDYDIGNVFITSGTGVIGYRVALSLLELGVPNVRVGIWQGDRQGEEPKQRTLADNIATLLRYRGADVIDFDWSDTSGFAAALKDVNTVFCSIPHVDGWADVFPEFLCMCRKLRHVEHFVKISFMRNNAMGDLYRENVQFVKFHAICDELLEQFSEKSRLSHTILACTHFMSTPLLHQGSLLTRQQKFVTASYGMGVNYVSPNDVADAVLVVLLNRKVHRNKSYNLSGRYAIRDSDIALLLSKKYGTEIKHIQLGYHEYKQDVRTRGLPEWLIRDSAEFERMKATGIDEHGTSYTKDIEKLLGRKPETFEDYLDSTTTMRPGMKFNLATN